LRARARVYLYAVLSLVFDVSSECNVGGEYGALFGAMFDTDGCMSWISLLAYGRAQAGGAVAVSSSRVALFGTFSGTVSFGLKQGDNITSAVAGRTADVYYSVVNVQELGMLPSDELVRGLWQYAVLGAFALLFLLASLCLIGLYTSKNRYDGSAASRRLLADTRRRHRRRRRRRDATADNARNINANDDDNNAAVNAHDDDRNDDDHDHDDNDDDDDDDDNDNNKGRSNSPPHIVDDADLGLAFTDASVSHLAQSQSKDNQHIDDDDDDDHDDHDDDDELDHENIDKNNNNNNNNNDKNITNDTIIEK
jgi:hypothetical protein